MYVWMYVCYIIICCFIFNVPNVLQVQHLAVNCIQKNVRKYMSIRDWEWWRLYTKVQPLLNVHRTEEELHNLEVRGIYRSYPTTF